MKLLLPCTCAIILSGCEYTGAGADALFVLAVLVGAGGLISVGVMLIQAHRRSPAEEKEKKIQAYHRAKKAREKRRKSR